MARKRRWRGEGERRRDGHQQSIHWIGDEHPVANGTSGPFLFAKNRRHEITSVPIPLLEILSHYNKASASLRYRLPAWRREPPSGAKAIIDNESTLHALSPKTYLQMVKPDAVPS